MARMKVLHGHCIRVMRRMPGASVDAIVTDPPYGLKFMGKGWDDIGRGNAQQAWHARWVVEAYRVLKPGGHLLAFGGTRTHHRLACAVEDAGFEIRDSITWLYASGFPKSLDISKALDKAAGAEREVLSERRTGKSGTPGGKAAYSGIRGDDVTLTSSPATDAAKEWDGWGTGLKPAHEPVVVARKPISGRNVALNVLEHGTGAINVGGCLVAHGEPEKRTIRTVGNSVNMHGGTLASPNPAGRWPANVVFSCSCGDGHEEGCPVGELDAQSGVSKSTNKPRRNKGENNGMAMNRGSERWTSHGHDDSGGASRFFFVAKASRAERNAGLEGMPERRPDRNTGHTDGRQWDIPGSHSKPRANTHPTVKPLKLMRYLVRLVTPPGGVVLDPFAGSGTTGVAAILEGFDPILIELTGEYIPIIEARLAWAEKQPVQW